VSAHEGRELAKSFDCPFLETSARTRINVEESFFELVREIKRGKAEVGGKQEGGGKKKKLKCQVL
jgi:GTPase KRas protein